MAVHQNMHDMCLDQVPMAEHKKLYSMCQEGKVEEVRMCLARGGDPNKKVSTYGDTAFQAAVIQGY